ncbi:HIT domain-containing protein [Pseudomonas aeruginosa]|uniref:HIT domain-containing protein n=10 Tax=Pseudomonas aeruginosa TaxID=287 RepID=A0A509JQ98_PSEAI|nr:HIT domain-containing protein [Pseudomonas aeruginosa]OWK95311.1 HIT domain-containing protein [Pseudomonas aeruginosa 148]ASD07435.1 HIT domain-containing protein [Pseudomonas aeruginosa]ASD07502.1 HIT domain-containing protein [Pseudomonas aeruginosa]ASP09666.1 HIT domain-containing protein [Pseudomonas aeruginosa]
MFDVALYSFGRHLMGRSAGVARQAGAGGCAGLLWPGGEVSCAAVTAGPFSEGGAKLSMNDGRTGEVSMFALDPRLEQDTLLLGDFPLSRLLLMNDARYPWFILVPRREDVTELFQLDVDDQQALWREATLLAEVLKDTFRADKMNVANLGNVVSQLHMHVIVRRRGDDAWPGPVWGRHPAQPYSSEQVEAIRGKLRMVLTDGFRFAGEA